MSQGIQNSFLWGASTAPHQTEGNNVNSDWWALEQRIPQMVPSGDTNDSYHRFADEMRLLADAGLNAYRFGIEWARIQPTPDSFSLAELAHYRRMIDTALGLGLSPVITLHHFSSPRWFVEEGGWLGDTAIDRFVAYAAKSTEILDGVDWIATINEPNVFAVMTGMSAMFNAGGMPEQREGEPFVLPRPSLEVGARLVEVHQAARSALRERTDAAIGWTIAGQAYYSKPENAERLREERYAREDLYLEGSRGDDWVGVQSYHTQEIGPEGPIPHAPEEGEFVTGPFTPEALAICARHAWEVTKGVPVLVTENGYSTLDESKRIAFIEEAVGGLLAARADGVDVKGYLHWSLLDNYEWGQWNTRFGLIDVNRETFERTPKESLARFGEFAHRQQT